MPTQKDTYILGISAFYHDSAACLVKNGSILAAAQEERFSRIKHDSAFPKQSIKYCLKEAGITTKDLSYVGFYEKPFIKFERLLFTYLAYAPFGVLSFLKAMPLMLKKKIFLKDLIQRELKYNGEIIFTEHHESHAASAFYPSPFDEAAVLTMDGVGEWASASYGAGEGNDLKLQAEIKFPHSLGLLYSAFTYYAGFRVNSGEYKLMGLAPYGEPKYVGLIKKELVDIKGDGSIKLNMDYFNYGAGLTMTNRRFHALFGGAPRKPETEIRQKDMDIARSIQEVTGEIMVKMANHVHAVTGKENLCLAGGVTLNCVGNGRILRESKFKNIWIQPAAGDAGGALGVALFIWYRYLDNERISDNVHDKQAGSLLGPEYTDEDIKSYLDGIGAVYEPCSAGRVAQLLKEQKIIGLCNGRMEFGPRALGARSIIADARSEEMQSALNKKIKFRESFRPFAPSVLEGKAEEYFTLQSKSPYMNMVAQVADCQLEDDRNNAQEGGPLNRFQSKRSAIPAVTHVDCSARIQTVSPDANPQFYQIIQEFFKETGSAVIINTSFNIRGEPIACTPEDAYRCFMCTEIDYLVLGNYLCDKTKQPHQNRFVKENISRVLD